MRIIPPSAYRRMKWKNGGGETIEIAVSPEGASLETFDWRLSMARVDAPGPFSVFPGVDRTLALLDGAALRLRFDGRVETLTPESEPLTFPADVAAEADLPKGGITDLNAMSRRGRIRHELRRLVLHARTSLTRAGDDTFLLAWTGAFTVRSDGSELNVEAGETLHIAPPEGRAVEITPRDTAVLYEVAFRRQ